MKKKLKLAFLLILISIAAVTSCSKKDSPADEGGADAKWPVLGEITVVGVTSTSITIKIPVINTGNYPLTKYSVYVGVGDDPFIAGVTGPGITVVLTSSSDTEFTVEIKGLATNYPYRIIGWVSNKYQASQKNMTPMLIIRTSN